LTATSAGSQAFEELPAEQQRAGQAGRAEAAELDRAGGDLAVRQRAEVAAQAAALAGTGQVVVDAEPERAGPGQG
jgi:hypothetical protein